MENKGLGLNPLSLKDECLFNMSKHLFTSITNIEVLSELPTQTLKDVYSLLLKTEERLLIFAKREMVSPKFLLKRCYLGDNLKAFRSNLLIVEKLHSVSQQELRVDLEKSGYATILKLLKQIYEKYNAPYVSIREEQIRFVLFLFGINSDDRLLRRKAQVMNTLMNRLLMYEDPADVCKMYKAKFDVYLEAHKISFLFARHMHNQGKRAERDRFHQINDELYHLVWYYAFRCYPQEDYMLLEQCLNYYTL